MSHIESELHEALLDLTPDMHDAEEQAVIIAEASEIYRRLSGSAKSRHASRQAGAHESMMMDSLLQAMGRLRDWTDDLQDNWHNKQIDVSGLSADQIVHRLSYSNRYSSTGFGTNMDILDDDDLDIFLREEPKGRSADDYEHDDLIHDKALYHKPGQGRHRSDSLSRR